MTTRLQGKVVEWNDQRGFGFVLQHGADQKLFLHHSDVEIGRPKLGDIVTFVVAQGDRGPKSAQVRIVNVGSRVTDSAAGEGRAGMNWTSVLISCAIVGGLAWAGWGAYQRAMLRNQPIPDYAANQPAPQPAPEPAPGAIPGIANPPAASRFACDGRKHCSEMKSCEEAKFFINNCPGTLMDGDNDGIPCETSLCR